MAYENGKTYEIVLSHYQSVALNLRGNDSIHNNRNVNLYSRDGSSDQKWLLRVYSGYAKILCSANNSFGLDYYYGSSNRHNCDIYQESGNEDSKIDLITVNASLNYYRIKLCGSGSQGNGRYLTASSAAYGADVRWMPYDGDSNSLYQIWKLIPVNDNPPYEGEHSSVPTALAGQTWFVKNYMTNKNLNVYGNDTVANERNVNVYDKENCLAQKWQAVQKPNGAKLVTAVNSAYALNIHTTDNNCTMYPEQNNDYDSVLQFIPYVTRSIPASENIYYIKMANHNKYLAAQTTGSGRNVQWESNTAGYCLWKFMTEEEMFDLTSSTPTEIKDIEFHLRAGNSSCYLNVHGNDTVAVSRNVNIYDKDKCKAQTWIATDYNQSARLITTINKAFGLNINSNENPNCTMYTVEGNDMDSAVEFEYVAPKSYRIKLCGHDKYLTVDGDLVSGTNVVWGDSRYNATVWTFETETEIFIPAPAAPTEIANKTVFINAWGTSYYLNVHGSDTVANTRNVDVFLLENCMAQRWTVLNSECGPKIHTNIDDTFAINYYNYDCTMYKAENNDVDSVVEFIYVAPKVYKIKLSYRDKYLTIAGDPSLGSDVVWADNISDAVSWNFIDEEDIALPEGTIGGAFTPDSTLVTSVIPAHTNNYTPNRNVNGSPISEICIHHAAGNITVGTLGALWQNPNRAGSSHYGVNGTQIGQYVKESDIAWTNGHWESNKRSVTIETANSSGAPEWLVSDTTLNTLISLVADIARRNNLGKLVVGDNLTYHSMYSATLCPGPYLLSKLTYIANMANELNSIIEENANNLAGGTYYLKNLTTNSYLNAEKSSNRIYVECAYDTPSQKWNIEQSNTGLKLISNISDLPSLVVGENNSCRLNLTGNYEDCNIELIPYIDGIIKYSDNVFRIKVEGENLYLSTDRNTGTDVCWSTFANSDLWKFVSPFDIIPEIKNNTLRLFINSFQSVLGIDNNGMDEIFGENCCSFDIDTINLGFVEISTRCDIENNIVSEEGYGAYVKIDSTNPDNNSIGYENDYFGIDAILEKFADATDTASLKEKISDLSMLLKGGNFAFKTSISNALCGKFDILCNLDLMPNHPEAHLELAIIFHIDIDFNIDSHIKFNFESVGTTNEIILMSAPIILFLTIVMKFRTTISNVFNVFITEFPTNNIFRLA